MTTLAVAVATSLKKQETWEENTRKMQRLCSNFFFYLIKWNYEEKETHKLCYIKRWTASFLWHFNPLTHWLYWLTFSRRAAVSPHVLWLPALPKQAACSPSLWAVPLTQAVWGSLLAISVPFPFLYFQAGQTKENLHSQLLFQASAFVAWQSWKHKAGIWKHSTIQPAWKAPVQAGSVGVHRDPAEADAKNQKMPTALRNPQ